tara:strand:- start:9207 stop:9737 length:531 start_codon:yes stop_codon:yes gene_type:complete
MAKNYFEGIITDDLKTLFNDAIKGLIEGGAGTIPCTIYYGITKWESCDNCLYDPIGKKSSNRYQNGGAVPFGHGGICPVCNGEGKRPVISTENIDLVVVFDYKEFMGMSTPVNNPEGLIQTMATKEATPKFKRAKELQVATDIAGYGDQRFQRHSEPQPLGLGNNEFVICTWKRVK